MSKDKAKLELEAVARILGAMNKYEWLALRRRERARRRAERALAKAIREVTGGGATLFEQERGDGVNRNGKAGNPYWTVAVCRRHFIPMEWIVPKAKLFPRCRCCGEILEGQPAYKRDRRGEPRG